MRAASLMRIKNKNSPLPITRGLNSFKYVIHLVFKLEQTNNLFSSSCLWNLFYFYIYDTSFHFRNKNHTAAFLLCFLQALVCDVLKNCVTSLRPPYGIHINLSLSLTPHFHQVLR